MRSLRLAPEPFHLIGADTNKYYLQRAETDERHLAPRASDEDYIPFIRQLVRETGAELVFAQPDAEIAVLSVHRDAIGARTFLPSPTTVGLLQDKFASNKRWAGAGLEIPATIMVDTSDDVERAFQEFGRPVWLRPVIGSAGRGALAARDVTEAVTWLDFNKGWGRYTAAEYLSERSVTWQSIWHDGDLVVAQGRLRGKLPRHTAVELQAQDGREWRTFKTLPVRRGGRFSYRYRFRHTTVPAQFLWRIKVRRQAALPYAPTTSKPGASSARRIASSA